jgi:hypothetical protein
MKKFIFLISSLLCMLSIPAQEKQVPMDESGKLTVIDRSLERKLKLFESYPGFKEARLYQTGDTLYVLEITTETQQNTERHKINFTETGIVDFRKSVSEKLSYKAPGALLNQEGRTSLLIGSSIVSYAYYGTAAAAIVGVSNYESTIGVYFLTSGIGFYLPFALTKDKEVTMGEANLSSYFQTRGIAYGALAPLIFSDSPDYRVVLGLGAATSIAGGIIGYNIAKKNKIDDGQAMTIGAYGDFGMGIGLGTAHLLGLLDGDNPGTGIALSTLAGAAGGLYLGNYLSKKQYYTSGDAMMLYNAGLLGAYIPLSLVAISEPENAKWVSVAGTLGAIGGIYLGDKIAKKYDFSFRQGIFISLSEAAGGLIGMGLGYIFSNNNSVLGGKTALVLSGIGALAGFALTTYSYSKDVNQEDKNLSFKMNINPLGLLSMSGNNSSLTKGYPIPLLTGTLRF